MGSVVINGTEYKGCTDWIKNMFLEVMGGWNEIREYYAPKDCPVFCMGCKRCFANDISVCPQAMYTMPVRVS